MITADAVKERLSCRQLIESVGIRINRTGFCVCPFHADTDASLKVYDDGRGWCCFGCHKGGDVINFASLYYGLGFRETISRLNADFNLGLEDSDSSDSNALLARVRVAAIKASREREKRLKQAAESAYWAAFDKWRDADRRMILYEPSRDAQEWPDEFVQALRDRENAIPGLEIAADGRVCNHG